MATSSSSSHFASTSISSVRSYKYEVFISFRGEDTRKTFVDHFYSSLVDRQIHTYKDDETLPRGESIHSSLLGAIEESRIAVVILSKNYAGSSWCLEELAHIMKCKEERDLIVMPIFYDVAPSDVRKPKKKLRWKAFFKKEVKNVTKATLWRKVLLDVCNIAGWELKNIANGHESKVIKEIVDTIFDRLFSLTSDVDDDLVGMTTRLNDLNSLIDAGSGDVRMVGIWGVGGSGKTTLAFSLYKKISCHFQGHCIVDNIQVESNKHGLKSLQQKLLSSVLKTERWVQSVEEGKVMIKSMLCKSKVLILLDDVNDLDQLEALAGSHKWFGSGSLIIITTRDEHLLRSHKIDKVYRVKLLLEDEAMRLFNMHAYNENDPIEDYEKLSLRMVSYASGLPLALKVLGSFLYDKNKSEWISAFDKLNDIPDPKIMDVLKISYDGLETYQKELFLDIVCFWRWESVDDTMEILEACDFHPKIGIKVLREKALISIVDGRFDMHDLVQEMGLYIVRGEYPKNLEKHSRVWKDEEIKSMCFGDTTMEYHETKAMVFKFYYEDNDRDPLLPLCKIVSNMKKLRFLMVRVKKLSELWVKVSLTLNEEVEEVEEHDEGPNFLSSELRYIDWDKYPASPFPESFQPLKLVVLKLSSMQKELWKGCKYLPHLKVLELFAMKKLLNTPDFGGLPSLQKLILTRCDKLEEIHPSLGYHTSLVYLSILGCYNLKRLPTLVHMKNLKTLEIKACQLNDGQLPYGIGELSNLQELNIRGNDFSRLDFSIAQLTQLKVLDVSSCNMLLELPELPSNLAILKADYCDSLSSVEDCHKKCKQLCEVSLHGGSVIRGGEKLLQSMLEGNAIENGSMLLRLQGVEVAKGFTPPLLRGGKCRVQLVSKTWHNDFCGFLICVVLPYNLSSIVLTMNEVMSGRDSQDDDVVWEESDDDNDSHQVDVINTRGGCLFRQRYTNALSVKNSVHEWDYTLVWYVSFGSLRNTTWWDQRHKALLFRINDKYNSNQKCNAISVRLVDQRSRTSLMETSTSYSHHAPRFKIKGDTTSALTISLELIRWES